MEPVCCLSLIQNFILSSTDVTNRGDETSNTVMKELFSWHSTLKPEDAFPARTRNDNARQDILMQILPQSVFHLKMLIYMYIYNKYIDNVYCCYIKRHYLKRNECATGVWMGNVSVAFCPWVELVQETFILCNTSLDAGLLWIWIL